MKRGPTDCTHEHEYAASKTLYMYSLLSITSLQIILCKGNAILAIMQIIWVLIRLFICSFSSFAAIHKFTSVWRAVKRRKMRNFANKSAIKDMAIVVILIGLAVSIVILYTHYSAYKSGGKEINKLTPGRILFWIIFGQIFAWGCLANILDPSFSDLSKIGGR